MEKSILESYQKRLETIQATLDENKIVLDAGIGTTLSYESIYDQFNKALEEAQAKLDELQQPIDMSDIGSAKVIDRRASNVRSEYSDDREGFLISEYDKRRLDGYEGPKYAEIFDEIKQIRENKRAEKIASLKDDMQETQKLEAQVKAVEEAQKAKAELEAELKAEQAKTQAEIDGVDKQKASIYKKIEGIKASIDAAQTAIRLKSLPASAFRATVQAKQDCIAKKAKLEAKIESLNQQIDELKGDYFDIDDLLAQLNGREEQELSNGPQGEIEPELVTQEVPQVEPVAQEEPQAEPAVQGEEQAEEGQPDLTDDAEERAKQEDEMWAKYEELAAEKSELEENKDYIMNAKMSLHKGDELAEEEKIRKATEREVRAYGDTGITPKPEEGLPLGPFRVPVKENAKPQKAQQPVQPKQNMIVTQKQPKKEPSKVTYKIKQAGLELSENGMPDYYVILIDSEGNESKKYNEPRNGYYNITIPSKEPDAKEEAMLKELRAKGISDVKGFYDFGLAKLLQEIDAKYATTGEQDYIKMMVGKNSDSPIKNKPFDVEYNFSNLEKMPGDKEDKDKIKYIKAIANANAKVGIATYEKAPTILTKISSAIKEMWKKVTTKRLPDGNQAPKKPTPEKIVEKYKKSWQDKDFDLEQFIKDCQMTPEEADTFRKAHQNRVKNAQWRKNIAEQAKTAPSALTEDEKLCECYRDLYKPGFDARQIKGLTDEQAQIIQADYEKYMNEQTALANFHSRNRKMKSIKAIKNAPKKLVDAIKGKMTLSPRSKSNLRQRSGQKSNYIGGKTPASKVYKGAER